MFRCKCRWVDLCSGTYTLAASNGCVGGVQFIQTAAAIWVAKRCQKVVESG